MTLPGASRLDKALAAVQVDATDTKVAKAAGELVAAEARAKSFSSRVAKTGKVRVRRGVAFVTFGSPATPWALPGHFGHGTPSSPRAQGGWMAPNPFLYDASDVRREQVIDLYLTRCVQAIKANGL
jgi:hypothetical protein